MSDSIPETRFFSTKSSPTNSALNKAVSLREQKRACAALCMVQVAVIAAAPSAVKNLVCLIVKVSVAAFACTVGQVPSIKAKTWSKLEAHCLVNATVGKTLKDLFHHVYNVVMFLTFSPFFCFVVGSFSPEKCKKAHDVMGVTAPQKKPTEEKQDEPSDIDESSDVGASIEVVNTNESPTTTSHVQTIISQFQGHQTSPNKTPTIDKQPQNGLDSQKVQPPKQPEPKHVDLPQVKQPTTPIEDNSHHDHGQSPEPKKPEFIKPVDEPRPVIPEKPVEVETPKPALSTDVREKITSLLKKAGLENPPPPEPLPEVTEERQSFLDSIKKFDTGSLRKGIKRNSDEPRKSDGSLAGVLGHNSVLEKALKQENDKVRQSTLVRTPSSNDGWSDEDEPTKPTSTPAPAPVIPKIVPKQETPAKKTSSPPPKAISPTASKGKGSRMNTQLFDALMDEARAEALSSIVKKGRMNRDTMNRSEADKVASLKARELEEAKQKRRSITETDFFKQPESEPAPEEKDRLEVEKEEDDEEDSNAPTPTSSPTEQNAPKEQTTTDSTEGEFTEVLSRQQKRTARRRQEQTKGANSNQNPPENPT